MNMCEHGYYDDEHCIACSSSANYIPPRMTAKSAVTIFCISACLWIVIIAVSAWFFGFVGTEGAN